jgi:hypothetical protein
MHILFLFRVNKNLCAFLKGGLFYDQKKNHAFKHTDFLPYTEFCQFEGPVENGRFNQVCPAA